MKHLLRPSTVDIERDQQSGREGEREGRRKENGENVSGGAEGKKKQGLMGPKFYLLYFLVELGIFHIHRPPPPRPHTPSRCH